VIIGGSKNRMAKIVMSPLNFFKGSFFDHAFKAKPAPQDCS
jgi:hypothetical protein